MIGGRAKHVVGYMLDFLFAPEQARTPLRVLSGGERGRLFFFNETATTEIYTLSLHDALPILSTAIPSCCPCPSRSSCGASTGGCSRRSEEHTFELQSRLHLVCRLLLEKK